VLFISEWKCMVYVGDPQQHFAGQRRRSYDVYDSGQGDDSSGESKKAKMFLDERELSIR